MKNFHLLTLCKLTDGSPPMTGEGMPCSQIKQNCFQVRIITINHIYNHDTTSSLFYGALFAIRPILNATEDNQSGSKHVTQIQVDLFMLVEHLDTKRRG
jgi:hypothetical protein